MAQVHKAMFGDIVEPSVNLGTRRWHTFPLSIAVHAVVIVAVVIIPLIAYDVLPTPYSRMDSFRTVSLPPAPSPPQPPPTTASKAVADTVNPDLAPLDPPPAIAPEPPDLGFDRRLETTGVLIGIVDGGDLQPLPAPPPTSLSPALPPVRVGGTIERPVKTKDVRPEYPQLARISHVQGLVIIEATIAADGTVQEARVLRSIPLLDAAALDAVKQWEFTPTLLNGVPVPVIMTVTVQFTLGR